MGFEQLNNDIDDGAGFAGTRFGGAPYDSVNGWGDKQQIANFACGAIQTVASVVGSATGVGGPLGLAVSVAAGAVTNGIAAYDSQKTVAGLKRILEHPSLKAANSVEAKDLVEIVGYCLQKRTSRRDRQIASAAAVGGGVSVFQNVKGIYKAARGTKGVNRNRHSQRLYQLAGANGTVGRLAQQVVALICGGSFESMMKSAISQGMQSGV